jgi:hypothetical protein
VKPFDEKALSSVQWEPKSGSLCTEFPKDRWGYTNRCDLMSFGNYSAFACCGARTALGLSAAFRSNNIEKEKQDFLTLWCKYQGKQVTIYMLATTYQMNQAKTMKNSVLAFLLELGAKEVSSLPNVVHGPNNLHMIAFCPHTCWDKVSKYVYEVPSKGNWDLPVFVPMWYKEQEEGKAPEPVKELKESVPVVTKEWFGQFEFYPKPEAIQVKIKSPKPLGPARDRFGRFVKVVK